MLAAAQRRSLRSLERESGFHVRRWASGRRRPSRDQLAAVEALLGVPAGFLLGVLP